MRGARGLVACAVFFACGSGGSDGSAGSAPSDAGATTSSADGSLGPHSSGPPTAPSPGTTTGVNLYVQADVIIFPGADAGAATTQALVTLQSLDSNTALAGATVNITPYGGRTVTLAEETSVVGVRYVSTFEQPPAASYELDVVHTTGARTGIVVLAPSVYTASLAPPPQEHTVSSVHWLPNNEAEVGAYIIAGSYGTPGGSPLPDSGSFDLPATTFKVGLPSSVTVQRARTFTVSKQVGAKAIVNVILPSVAVKP